MSEVVQKREHVTTWPVPDGLNGANGILALSAVVMVSRLAFEHVLEAVGVLGLVVMFVLAVATALHGDLGVCGVLVQKLAVQELILALGFV